MAVVRLPRCNHTHFHGQVEKGAVWLQRKNRDLNLIINHFFPMITAVIRQQCNFFRQLAPNKRQKNFSNQRLKVTPSAHAFFRVELEHS